MSKRKRKAWPVLLCLPVSFVFSYGVWIFAVLASEIVWDMNGQDGVWMTFFGNPRVGTFGGCTHWVPLIVGGAALALPWLLLIFPIGRRIEKLVPESN
jgi:hypothetical protein